MPLGIQDCARGASRQDSSRFREWPMGWPNASVRSQVTTPQALAPESRDSELTEFVVEVPFLSAIMSRFSHGIAPVLGFSAGKSWCFSAAS